eukprot:jgi/Hompol1/21/HPOL_005201-RA
MALHSSETETAAALAASSLLQTPQTTSHDQMLESVLGERSAAVAIRAPARIAVRPSASRPRTSDQTTEHAFVEQLNEGGSDRSSFGDSSSLIADSATQAEISMLHTGHRSQRDAAIISDMHKSVNASGAIHGEEILDRLLMEARRIQVEHSAAAQPANGIRAQRLRALASRRRASKMAPLSDKEHAMLASIYSQILVAALKPKELEMRQDPELIITHEFPKRSAPVFTENKFAYIRINVTNTGTSIKSLFMVQTLFRRPDLGNKVIGKNPFHEISFTLRPGKSIIYNHQFFASVEPQDCHLHLMFDYDDHDHHDHYRMVAIDTPIKVVYNDDLFDWYSIAQYIYSIILTTAVTALIYYTCFYNQDGSKPQYKPKKKNLPAPATATRMDEPDMAWVPSHVSHQQNLATSQIKKRK